MGVQGWRSDRLRHWCTAITSLIVDFWTDALASLPEDKKRVKQLSRPLAPAAQEPAEPVQAFLARHYHPSAVGLNTSNLH